MLNQAVIYGSQVFRGNPTLVSVPDPPKHEIKHGSGGRGLGQNLTSHTHNKQPLFLRGE